MKKMFLIMFAVMAAVSVNVQIVKNMKYPKGHFGIRAAYTSNTLTCYGEKSEAKSFVSGGLAADFRVASIPLYLETGAYYINRGYKAIDVDYDWGHNWGDVYESDFDNHSVMVPLLMSYHLYLTDNMAVQPFVGPYVEYGFDREEVSAGIRTGVGYNFGRLYVNVGYDFGFNIDEKKNNAFFATIGFNFAGGY